MQFIRLYLQNINAKNIAIRLDVLWKLPSCIGTLDGMQIGIEKFSQTGFDNFN